MALVDLDTYKSLTGVTGSAQDTRLQLLLNAAIAAVRAYCQQHFEQASYTEYHSGNGTRKLALRQLPVTAITGVWLDPTGFYDVPATSFTSATQLTEGTDFVLDRGVDGSTSKSGLLLRIGADWPRTQGVRLYGRLAVEQHPAFGNVKVTYTAGYATVPGDIQLATCLVAQQMLRASQRGGPLGSERLGDYAYTLASAALLAQDMGNARTLLAPYKQIGW